MDKEEYIRRFDWAARFCRDFAQSLVIEQLPERLKFNILRVEQVEQMDRLVKVKLPGGRLLYPDELRGMEYVKARKLLWVDGRVPVWVNMTVTRVEDDATVIYLMFSDFITDNERLFYHKREGNPPFHVLGPPVPVGWKSLKVSGKYSLLESRGPQ